VLLLIIIQIIPWIVQAVNVVYVKYKARSGLQKSVMTIYFYYQIANVYVTVTSGTIFGALLAIIDTPASTFSILGKALPQVGVYFTDVIITKAMVGLVFELVQAWPFVQVLFINLFCSNSVRTPRDLRSRAFQPPELRYGWIYPSFLFALLICLVYAQIVPIIMPVGVVYFSLALVVYKYQLMVCYIPKFEGGGIFWPLIFHQTIVSLAAAQFTLIGYMVIKTSFQCAAVLFLLPIITITAGYKLNKSWGAASDRLSLQKARDIDLEHQEIRMSEAQEGRRPSASICEGFTQEAYLQPALAEGALEPELGAQEEDHKDLNWKPDEYKMMV